jgi:hypothetical protein
MRNNPRFPYLLFAIGIIGMASYARIVAHVGPAFLRSESVIDFATGLFLSIEMAGAVLMFRSGMSRCRRSTS